MFKIHGHRDDDIVEVCIAVPIAAVSLPLWPVIVTLTVAIVTRVFGI